MENVVHEKSIVLFLLVNNVIPKLSASWLLVFSCTFRRETPLGNEIYLSKYLW